MSKATIPTVKFDVSRVTDAVRADLKRNIQSFREIDKSRLDEVYSAALRSITAGRDMSIIYNVLNQMHIDGVTQERAAEIARFLNNRATAFMHRERLVAHGTERAVWHYSGAPCDPQSTSIASSQTAAHKAANGKAFKVDKGMFLDGKWTWPGFEPECKCFMRGVVAGFS